MYTNEEHLGFNNGCLKCLLLINNLICINQKYMLQSNEVSFFKFLWTISMMEIYKYFTFVTFHISATSLSVPTATLPTISAPHNHSISCLQVLWSLPFLAQFSKICSLNLTSALLIWTLTVHTFMPWRTLFSLPVRGFPFSEHPSFVMLVQLWIILYFHVSCFKLLPQKHDKTY